MPIDEAIMHADKHSMYVRVVVQGEQWMGWDGNGWDEGKRETESSSGVAQQQSRAAGRIESLGGPTEYRHWVALQWVHSMKRLVIALHLEATHPERPRWITSEVNGMRNGSG